jgi:preprotein translocase subunit SecF
MQLFADGKIYDFMGKRSALVLASVVMVIGSLLLLFVKGPRLGTDFKGGTEVELTFRGDVTDTQIREAVQSIGFSAPDVIHVKDEATNNRYLVRVEEVSAISDATRAATEQKLCYGENLGPECPDDAQATEVKFSPGGDKISVRYKQNPDIAKLREALTGIDGVDVRDVVVQNLRENKVEVLLKSRGDQLIDGLRREMGTELVPNDDQFNRALRIEWIGPKAGAQLRDSALKSIAVALVFIMIYIAFRFDLRFAPGSVVALVHDALVTIGVLVLLDKELNLTTVAAILTIVGYSVNDTVVVYDRVRENLGKMRGSSFVKIINTSLSEMLGRTILTSFTTVASMVMFFIWGTGTLKDFAFPLIIGLALGTYSSIYVALPLTHWLDRRFFARFMRPAKKRPVVRNKASAVV